jgi:Xaa-Pro aminopeptidase
VEFVDLSDAIRRIRMVKSPFEIELIRRSGAILSRVIGGAGSLIRPGMTELDLASSLESSLRREGHPGFTRMRMFNGELAFGTVSAGPSAAYPTRFPGPVGYVGTSPANAAGAGWRRLTPGDTVMIDLAGACEGYVSDETRTYVLGEAPADMKKAHETILELMRLVEERLRPGSRCDVLYQYALDFIRDTPYAAGFMGTGDSQVRFLGHGVGLELDELPVLASGFDIALEPGMVVAVEPKIFFPDRGGVGIENTYVITETGCENLTISPEEMIEVQADT